MARMVVFYGKDESHAIELRLGDGVNGPENVVFARYVDRYMLAPTRGEQWEPRQADPTDIDHVTIINAIHEVLEQYGKADLI